MILLLGGTSETAPLAQALLDEGFQVMVSMATDAPLDLPPSVVRRTGRLDVDGLVELCRCHDIKGLVDAGHPFAQQLHDTCRVASERSGVPLLRFCRESTALPPEVLLAEDHDVAARLAFACAGPVLLTTGSRTLAPYVAEARRTELPLLARVLDHPESLTACQEAGLLPAEIVTGRGPFSLEEDRALIRCHGARVLVTKDSGEAGGVDRKIEAARLEQCRVVVVGRREADRAAWTSLKDLARTARTVFGR